MNGRKNERPGIGLSADLEIIKKSQEKNAEIITQAKNLAEYYKGQNPTLEELRRELSKRLNTTETNLRKLIGRHFGETSLRTFFSDHGIKCKENPTKKAQSDFPKKQILSWFETFIKTNQRRPSTDEIKSAEKAGELPNAGLIKKITGESPLQITKRLRAKQEIGNLENTKNNAQNLPL